MLYSYLQYINTLCVAKTIHIEINIIILLYLITFDKRIYAILPCTHYQGHLRFFLQFLLYKFRCNKS